MHLNLVNNLIPTLAGEILAWDDLKFIKPTNYCANRQLFEKNTDISDKYKEKRVTELSGIVYKVYKDKLILALICNAWFDDI